MSYHDVLINVMLQSWNITWLERQDPWGLHQVKCQRVTEHNKSCR